MRRDLDTRDQIAPFHDLAVEDGEDLEWIEPVEPFQLSHADVDDPRNSGHQVQTALVGPTDVEVRPRHRAGKPDGRIVLVKFARLDDEHRDRFARIRGTQDPQIVRRQPPTL